MTPRRLAFIAAYLLEPNGTKAAIAAGFSARTAKQGASQTLKSPEVAAALDRLRGHVAPTVAEVAPQMPGGEQAVAGTLTPLAYMLAVVNDESADETRRDRMASAAACYCHPKIGEGGKKEQAGRAAKAASAGKYAPAAPPRLAAVNGRPVTSPKPSTQ